MRAPMFTESARTARARAERDPATRDRITYAHEHLAPHLGRSAADLRRLTRGRGLVGYSREIQAAGLTLGEAKAEGLIR